MLEIPWFFVYTGTWLFASAALVWPHCIYFYVVHKLTIFQILPTNYIL